jgi:hypothetical protein
MARPRARVAGRGALAARSPGTRRLVAATERPRHPPWHPWTTGIELAPGDELIRTGQDAITASTGHMIRLPAPLRPGGDQPPLLGLHGPPCDALDRLHRARHALGRTPRRPCAPQLPGRERRLHVHARRHAYVDAASAHDRSHPQSHALIAPRWQQRCETGPADTCGQPAAKPLDIIFPG